MKEIFKEYSKTILKSYLRLQKGDALSVNAEESELEEAKYLANDALEISGANVKIVTTINGKPQEVIEFDAPDQLTTKITGIAMVRLVNSNKECCEDPDRISAQDLPFIQKIGHLAQPLEIGRRIVVPWTVVSVDNPAPVLRPPFDTFDKLLEETKYRQTYLRHMDIHTMHVVGQGTDFTVEVPEDVWFVGGVQVLSNGRTYINTPDFDRLSFTLDKNSLNGYFTAKVCIAGKDKEIKFEFKDGKLFKHTSDAVLEKILSLDEDITKPGMFSFRDREFILSLGGSDTMSLSETPETEEDLPKNFNTSLYTVKCLLDNDSQITVTDCEGHEKELVRKGFFVQ